MTLKEMSVEYQKSSDKCREVLRTLQRKLRNPSLSQTDTLLLRRRCAILDDMVRETSATAKYLANYYSGGEASDARHES